MKQKETCYVRLGERIRHFRQVKNLTQLELAVAVGLTRTSIVNIESGVQRVALHDIEVFAGTFGLTPIRFLAGIFKD